MLMSDHSVNANMNQNIIDSCNNDGKTCSHVDYSSHQESIGVTNELYNSEKNDSETPSSNGKPAIFEKNNEKLLDEKPLVPNFIEIQGHMRDLMEKHGVLVFPKQEDKVYSLL